MAHLPSHLDRLGMLPSCCCSCPGVHPASEPLLFFIREPLALEVHQAVPFRARGEDKPQSEHPHRGLYKKESEESEEVLPEITTTIPGLVFLVLSFYTECPRSS